MNNIKKTIFKTQIESDIVVYFTFNMATGQSSAPLACQQNTYPITLYSNTDNPIIGTIFYTDTGLTIPYDGNNLWFKRDLNLTSYNIDNSGSLIQTSVDCAMTGYTYQIEQCETGEMWALEKIYPSFSIGDVVEFRKGIPPIGNIVCGTVLDDNFLAIFTATPISSIGRSCGDAVHCDIPPI